MTVDVRLSYVDIWNFTYNFLTLLSLQALEMDKENVKALFRRGKVCLLKCLNCMFWFVTFVGNCNLGEVTTTVHFKRLGTLVDCSF